MRYRAWVAAAVCSVAVAFTGCSGSSDTRTHRPRRRRPPRAPRAVGSGGGPAPAGHLLGGAAASVVDQQYWFDDSARVPCTEPHTTETVIAFSLPEPTIAEAEKALNFCDATFARTWASTRRAGFRGARLPSCPARRRSPPAPPGCAATRSFRRPPITAALAPPTCPPRGSPTLHRPTCGPAPTSLPTGPISRLSRATARTTTNRPGAWPS